MEHTLIATLPQLQLVCSSITIGIYLAGPISSDPDTAPARFEQAGDFVGSIFNPALVKSPIGLAISTEVPFIQDVNRYLHPLYMRECYEMLLKCDCIALLPGWERSKGAVYEARLAESLGMVPLFLHAHDGALRLDISSSLYAMADGEWVDMAVEALDGVLVIESDGESDRPIGVGNPFGLNIDIPEAEAMRDAARLTEDPLWPAT